ncbi:MAG TPA: AsmA-like C-terminal region-containing protein, partial [Saprospiraceae bacterium]|nr:AsmA-like C-terminal region-containing protein [Saprospiraceae bacterium]
MDLYLNNFTAKMNLHPLKIEKFKGKAHYEGKQLILENFSGIMGRSDFLVQMSYNFDTLQENKLKPNYFHLTSNALDLDQLMNYSNDNTTKPHSESYNVFTVPFPNIDIKTKIGKLNYHKYWLQEVSSTLRLTKNHYIYIDTMAMKVAKGYLQMSGYFNGSNPDNIYYHSTIYTQNLDIDKLLFKFDYLNSDQLVNNTLHGKISGTIKSTFKMHPDFTPIIDKSKAHMDLTITDGTLVNFSPMQALSKYFKDKNLNKIRFDTLKNVLEIDNGVIYIPRMNINSSLGYMELSGRQKIDMSMEYFIRIPLKMVTKLS